MATEFKSQICTTVEQSDRLLDLGLKPETADMHYLWAGYWHLSLEPWEHAVDDYPFDFHSEEEQEDWKLRHRAAWSLHRLIEMIQEVCPQVVIIFHRVDIRSNVKRIAYSFDVCDNLYDNIVDCIEWLIKEGYFPKEYLV